MSDVRKLTFYVEAFESYRHTDIQTYRPTYRQTDALDTSCRFAGGQLKVPKWNHNRPTWFTLISIFLLSFSLRFRLLQKQLRYTFSKNTELMSIILYPVFLTKRKRRLRYKKFVYLTHCSEAGCGHASHLPLCSRHPCVTDRPYGLAVTTVATRAGSISLGDAGEYQAEILKLT